MRAFPFRSRVFWLIVAYGALICLFIWDHAFHGHGDPALSHVAIEFLLMIAAMLGVLFFSQQLSKSRRLASQLKHKLDDAREQVSRWQHEEHDLIRDVRNAIDRKFDEWEFNDSEKEVAWCLLKGMSMKDIAKVRSSTDRSIRQQAYVLYHKAGLTGRAELSAYFLGGLVEHQAPD